MSPESWAGFSWVIGIWDQTVIQLLASIAPLFEALTDANLVAAGLVCWAWWIFVTFRVYDVGFFRGLAVGLIMFPVLAYGLSRTTITLPQGGGTIQVARIQEIGIQASMGIHDIYRSVLVDVLPRQTVAGSILPAQAAMDRAVGRSAALYEGSDLAQLIRDYNTSCAPQPAELAGPESAARVEALHAIGLMGGGGLGIPEDEISLLAQISAGAGGIVDFFRGYLGDTESNGGYVSWVMGGGIQMGADKAHDLREIQQRREAGRELLKAAGPFMGGRYALPTQQHWEAVFAGRQDVKPSYLPISLIPGQRSAVVSDQPGTTFTPLSCAEAYQIAQLGAEQAYRAMKASGAKMPGGQAVSAEAGTLAAAGAWQKFLSQSMQQTGMQDGNAELSGWALSIVQMIKNWFSWFDLQTLLPAYIVVNAWLFVLLILFGPLFLLLAPLRGVQVLIQWCQLLLFCVMTQISLHVLTIALSQAMAASAFTQAAAAAGWQGSAPDDALRGSTGMIGAMLLALSTWLVARLTGVDVSALAGSMSGAVSTATGMASTAGRVVGGAMKVGRLASIGRSAGRAGASGRTGATGLAGSGGNTSTPSSVRSAMANLNQNQNAAISRASRSSGGGNLVPPKPPQK